MSWVIIPLCAYTYVFCAAVLSRVVLENCMPLFAAVYLLLSLTRSIKGKGCRTSYRNVGKLLVSTEIDNAWPDGRPAVTFPVAERHRPFSGTKLYCLVSEAQCCERLAYKVVKPELYFVRLVVDLLFNTTNCATKSSTNCQLKAVKQVRNVPQNPRFLQLVVQQIHNKCTTNRTSGVRPFTQPRSDRELSPRPLDGQVRRLTPRCAPLRHATRSELWRKWTRCWRDGGVACTSVVCVYVHIRRWRSWRRWRTATRRPRTASSGRTRWDRRWGRSSRSTTTSWRACAPRWRPSTTSR